jgi:hypothetical protein
LGEQLPAEEPVVVKRQVLALEGKARGSVVGYAFTKVKAREQVIPEFSHVEQCNVNLSK